jgi:hypothetical protein
VNFRGIWKVAYFVSLCYIWSYVKYFGRFSFFYVYLLVKGSVSKLVRKCQEVTGSDRKCPVASERGREQNLLALGFIVSKTATENLGVIPCRIF